MSPCAVKGAGFKGNGNPLRKGPIWFGPVVDWRPTTDPAPLSAFGNAVPPIRATPVAVLGGLRDKRKGRMMHYFVYRTHKGESGVCRYTVEDAREDVLEDMSKGMAIAIQGKDYYTMARLGGRMEDVLTLDPVDEYNGPYRSISTVSYSDKEWHIEKCNNAMCTAQYRKGDDW